MKYAVFLLLGLFLGSALAKLPPPTAEEKAKLEKQAEAKKSQTEREKEDLARTQERVARQYRAQHPDQGTTLPPDAKAQKLKESDVPKSAKQPPGAPPHPYAGRKAKPQGQAHSAGSGS